MIYKQLYYDILQDIHHGDNPIHSNYGLTPAQFYDTVIEMQKYDLINNVLTLGPAGLDKYKRAMLHSAKVTDLGKRYLQRYAS